MAAPVVAAAAACNGGTASSKPAHSTSAAEAVRREVNIVMAILSAGISTGQAAHVNNPRRPPPLPLVGPGHDIIAGPYRGALRLSGGSSRPIQPGSDGYPQNGARRTRVPSYPPEHTA
ncbi:exported hypothetical protein [uncultured Stenotrophomonas sp.]|uniref:Uncharacterized protein n=1 Tax=uncultured Stenotrophomonas sp. TaxID=165438 RepID=A0A1Y5Q3G0_9GAMM|nr:exported hypothetical protein [uncultured Stenotrophomonas sp.]